MRGWLPELAGWIIGGALIGGVVTAQLVAAVAGGPVVAQVSSTPSPYPMPRAAASEFALSRR